MIKFCPYCGTERPTDAKFCPSCGKPYPDTVAPTEPPTAPSHTQIPSDYSATTAPTQQPLLTAPPYYMTLPENPREKTSSQYRPPAGSFLQRNLQAIFLPHEGQREIKYVSLKEAFSFYFIIALLSAAPFLLIATKVHLYLPTLGDLGPPLFIVLFVVNVIAALLNWVFIGGLILWLVFSINNTSPAQLRRLKDLLIVGAYMLIPSLITTAISTLTNAVLLKPKTFTLTSVNDETTMKQFTQYMISGTQSLLGAEGASIFLILLFAIGILWGALILYYAAIYNFNLQPESARNRTLIYVLVRIALFFILPSL